MNRVSARTIEWCSLAEAPVVPVDRSPWWRPGSRTRILRRYPFPLDGSCLRPIRGLKVVLVLRGPSRLQDLPAPHPVLALRALRRSSSGTFAFGTKRGFDLYHLRRGRVVECWTIVGDSRDVPTGVITDLRVPRRLARWKGDGRRRTSSPRAPWTITFAAATIAVAAQLVPHRQPVGHPAAPIDLTAQRQAVPPVAGERGPAATIAHLDRALDRFQITAVRGTADRFRLEATYLGGPQAALPAMPPDSELTVSVQSNGRITQLLIEEER